ncbi:MAG: MFS transporter [Candidatus Heimdallarchaeota archaeon]|nr:MFS transporter [Candidatus Heimdallarchaeota archaeon]MCK4289569.1 MFS transporter [Candidatus Heimdallarchaeota archaeon]
MFSTANINIFMQFYSAFALIYGVSKAAIGFITSIRNLISGLFQGSIGRLSDKIGRKKILIFGFIISFLIPLPLIFYRVQWFLILTSVIQALSVSFIIPSWNAVLGDVTQPSSRATFIGRITSVARIFSVVLTLGLAGIFAIIESRYENVLTIFGKVHYIGNNTQFGIVWIMASFNALLCIVLIFFMKETHVVSVEKQKEIPKMWVSLKDKSFRKFLIVQSVYGITMSIIWPINPIVITDENLLNLGDSFSKLAVLTSAFAVFIGLTTIIGGKICDKIGRKPTIIISIAILIFFPVSMIPAVATNRWALLLISRMVGGVGTGLNLVAINAYTLDMAPGELMGAYSGMREMFYGITTFIGSLISGFIVVALEAKFDALGYDDPIRPAIIAMCIGTTILRVMAATGYLFIDKVPVTMD